jgi:hypothetical protein
VVTQIHRNALRGEIGTVRALLEKSAGRDPLGEMSLRKRLAALESQFEQISTEIGTSATVALVFDGEPVRGASAIGADFAGRALQDYQELVAKHVATAELGGMAERGRLPGQINQQARMNVTGLVHGSFGFVLEEDGSDEPQMFDTPARRAIEQVTNLLSNVASADGRQFDTLLDELDVRIFQTLKRFVGTLHKSRATLRVAEEARELKLDSASVSRAYERVSQVDVEEEDDIIEGELLGLVPIQRRFEFRNNADGEVVQGRVDANLSADYLERIEQEGIVAGSKWRATIRRKTVHHPDGRHSAVSNILLDLVNTAE